MNYKMLFVVGMIFISACTNAITSGDQVTSQDSQVAGAAVSGASVYKDFNKAEYEQALSEGKVVYLEFYANWCPVCKRQEPEIESAFKDLKNEDIVGFRIHYNDKDVTADETDMARQYGIAYQYTKIIIDRDGNVVTKALEFWPKDRIISELRQYT